MDAKLKRKWLNGYSMTKPDTGGRGEGRATHTPGPLHLDGTYILDGRGFTIAACAVSPRVSRAEAIANANLFAAAPDLVKALEAAEEWLSGWASAEPYLTKIRAALAAKDGR